ncbi:sugar ABC transporter substrate-binding protein [Litchfieldella qijiaojingensis]|uniref:Probable sugar-binding periplasmic protein n=1 Tax=Litchfieldella qijiaojingensis TaxID=980347 RepID=A0ABQ2YRW3_9GAMM|nr:ABC transporter substrate-binding protein [Halomonas qijiaojingensis]GGX93264.1 sugar ABC transporter substrate-binding protein [Halomonas qijiaojingensis]
MKLLLKGLCLAVTMTAASAQDDAVADPGLAVDVVHYWISKSESAALDVYRQAWTEAGNRWADLPVENEAALKRIVSDRIANGYPPAVTQWNVDEGARELPEMGIVNDIEPVVREDHWRDRLPSFVLERISYQEKVYFAPSDIHVENWLWTSQKIFDELGLETPETWDDIFAAADRIAAAGYRPIALGSAPWEIALIFHNIMYYAMGPEEYARVFNGDAEAVLDPRMLDALDLLRRVSRYVEPPEARAGKNWADATAMIGRGEAGMQFMGDWAKGELVSLGYTADRDFGCNLTPGTSITYFMVIDAFAFPLTTREGETQAQQAFARMVLDPNNQVAFSRLKGSLPVRTDVDPRGLDRCGQLGLQRILDEKHEASVHSRAMPSHEMVAWISILAEFFDDKTISSRTAQQRLYQVVNVG